MDDQVEALNPAQFLKGQKLTTIPTSVETKSVELTRLWRNQQALLDSFLRRCSKECLSNLINYHEVRNANKQPNIRDVEMVLLQEEHTSRQVLKNALVLKLIPGRDGIGRTCHLRCDGNIIANCSPIQLEILLEMSQGGKNEVE
ncbi:hypothetical protein AVEN_86051-1 [Araneus ventricosus]|uniref:DUF5641 domain-containing protein n=1 Tax=Araneus ventricosus TaxID=182803 RepID=A0A4Y2MFZ5_ARAVE|nr:hypothetical protein AVEN_86051-1 [Araneus ventricosus]